MQKTQQDIQDEVTEKAKHAATVAAATANVAKNAFVSTVSGAKTLGEKAVVFGAVGGVVAFFLPWITILGTASFSGFRAAIDGSVVFWLYPISMVTCFLMSSFSKHSDPKKRILGARWYLVIGTLWFGPGIAAVCNAFSGAVGFGGYVATAAAGSILLGGFLQIGDGVNDIAKSA